MTRSHRPVGRCASVQRVRMSAAVSCWLLFIGAVPAAAGDHYAVVVTGASGGGVYAEKYDRWREAFVKTLHDTLGYKDSRVFVLAERERAGVLAATRENIQRVLGDLRRRLSKDDQLLILLIGHGTSVDGENGKFNLVGPDLAAVEWADLLKPMVGRLVFVDATGASYPFLRRLAASGRIVLTATDSAGQRFETVFPEFFVKAFEDPAADVDKNGRVSVWEAFSYASAAVRQWFEQRGQLATERPLLDDTGAGVGREAQSPGPDGALARATYLTFDRPPAGAPDAALASLLERRSALERELEDLRARKAAAPSAEYDAALERLLLDIATISQQIRAR